jgi:predicted nucleic acid-binding protein
MILVDTSVWVDHLRTGDTGLAALLDESNVLVHHFVIGELACGNLRRRSEVLALLGELPKAHHASDQEVLYFIERHRLMGLGIGYVDANLLASVSLTAEARLWTRDKRLSSVAQRLKLHFARHR